jgi:hypothetical protein
MKALDSDYRELTLEEHEILQRLLMEDFPGKREVSKQVGESLVQTIDENGSLRFRVLTDVKAPKVRSRIPVEGECKDIDGVLIHFLLHVVDDVVRELEIFKEDNSELRTWPNSNSISVFAPK